MDAVRANLYFKSADRARGRLHDLPERPTEVWLNLHAPSISHRDVVGATLASTARKDPPGRRFEWDNRAVMVVDIVESVRLVEQDESGIIARWFGFVERVKTQVLPECEGRLVKTLGDGMLLDFGDVRGAVSAALQIQQICDLDNAESPARAPNSAPYRHGGQRRHCREGRRSRTRRKYRRQAHVPGRSGRNRGFAARPRSADVDIGC